MWRSLHRRASNGFTLVELLVVILIVGILAGVAVPIYMNQKARAYRTSAVTDGHATAATISSGLFGLTSFGSTNGTIVVDATVKPATVTITLGTGATSPSVLYAAMTAGTTANGITYANTIQWCLDMVNNDQHVIYTDAGIVTAITSCGATPGTNGSSTTVSGGALTSDATYYYQTFLATGTLTVTGIGITGDVLIIGGGAGGASRMGGGGGAGGVLYASSISLTTGSIAIGPGGAGGVGPSTGSNGTQSSYGSYIALGGGHGASYGIGAAVVGGSGGGGSGYTGPNAGSAGTAGQGNAGGNGTAGGSYYYKAGGGGGAGMAGANGDPSTLVGAAGGNGIDTYSTWATVTGTGVSGYYAGGGGAGGQTNSDTPGAGGLGGGGIGGGASAGSGTPNTGSGGGGLRNAADSGSAIAGDGGSGIIIVRYLKTAVGG